MPSFSTGWPAACPPDDAAAIRPQTPLRFEAQSRTLTAMGDLRGRWRVSGGDGFMLTSDQTFLSLFASRSSTAPDHILLRLRPGADVWPPRSRGCGDLISDKSLRIRSYGRRRGKRICAISKPNARPG